MKQTRAMKRKQKALFQSIMSLILCFAMLTGTTFAWFSDSASSEGNIIQSGGLDVKLEYKKNFTDSWSDASNAVIFNYDQWEPGYSDVRYLQISNDGNLSFQYQITVEPVVTNPGTTGQEGTAGTQPNSGETASTQTDPGQNDPVAEAAENGGTTAPEGGNTPTGGMPVGTEGTSVNPMKLAEVIDVYFAPLTEEITSREMAVQKLTKIGTLADMIRNATPVSQGVILPKASFFAQETQVSPALIAATESTAGVIMLKMRETAGNEYMNLSAGEGFTVKILATQYAYEADNFGADYDTGAVEYFFPNFEGVPAISAPVTVDENNLTTKAVDLTNDAVSAKVPTGVKVADGVKELSLSVTKMEGNQANIQIGETEAKESFDVHIEGLAADNTTPILVNLNQIMPVGQNAGNVTLYHVENNVPVLMNQVATREAVLNHNDFYYDPATGDVIMALASFSEMVLVADTEAKWEGNYDYTWYNDVDAEFTIANADQLAAFGAIVGGMNGQNQDSFEGKTIKLISDINLADAEAENNPDLIFYPIGYYYNGESSAPSSTVYSFEGVFDGDGHTIANFYQNTWEIEGDYDGNYYKDAMGLFGYVVGGTVKNLTVDNFSSDGEYTPTGVIAAYAAGDATFENIAITNCNPRVYNTGNGGIIGIAGDTSAANDDHITLKNITVDNSNKISALWGSWDVACGGLVGMYRGNVDGSGNATGDTISFENCHVSAQIDVYNDVCANYQYYAYRYAGMIIGSVRHNTTNEQGKTIPNMTGISATGCTVNYGDWNDYYYCEFEKNTMASYSVDYQFSRVPHSELNFTDSNENGVVDADERASVTGCKHNHTAEENHQAIYLPFHQLFTGYSWGVSSIGLEKYNGIVTNLDITEGDQEESVEKFETKFTKDFLYRVGNKDTVSIGSLFVAKAGATINHSGVYVTIEKVDENTDVSGTFTANTTDWTKGTIQFSGTGVVKVTIQDYNFCTPTVLYLEVVDAVNATGATSATSNNVVLLNDCGFSSLEVSGGYTLYGNGFTMTCGSDSAALDTGYSFVTLNNGTLDNVQIVLPNFDYAVLYSSNMTESGNRNETTDKTRYFNVKSGVMASGNSQILNSRISGGRAALNVSGGNVVVDNSRIELGAVASILVGAANKLTLRDVTLVQKPTASTYDPSKKLMGFSVLLVCDTDGNAAPVTIEGTLVQNAWVDETDKQYVPSAGQSIISTVLGKTEYLHDVDGDGTNESLNLGFAYMPESLTSKVNTTTITDNRTNKAGVPYDYAEVSILNGKTYVYSYKNSNGTEDDFKKESEYSPNKNGDIITVNYADAADGLENGKSYGTDGWVYELNVDLDKLSGYALDFSKLSMSVNGATVTDFKVNGNTKPGSPVAVTAGGTTYTLSATVNGKEYTATYKVTGTETSKESPSLVAANYEAGLCVASSHGGTWHGAAPALQGIQIKYWSVAEKQYKTIKLSDYTPTTAGKQNGNNNTWTYSPANGDFTLMLTGGQVHSKNNVYAMPVVCDGTLYFVAANSNGLVNSGNDARTIPVTYTFKDNNNGDVLTFSHSWSVAENQNAQYKYSDFCNGTLTKLEASSGGGSCVTPDTLITLANGKQVRVDSLTGAEELLVWNMETGKLDSAPIMFVDSDPMAQMEVIYLHFSDGTVVKAISEHGFWDYDLNRYVYLDRNAESYVGHTFAKQSGNDLSKVKLTKVELKNETTTAWSPVTAGHLCYFVNGMLSMPGGVGGLFNIFDVNPETMTYDYEAMAKDIETYGLFTYEEMNAIAPLSEDMFNAAGGAYLKISIGKGNMTVEELVAMISRYSKYI